MKMLKCEKCENDDPDRFSFTDRPIAARDVVDVAEDGTLLISSSFELDYDEGYEDSYRLHCVKCGHSFIPPMKVEHV